MIWKKNVLAKFRKKHFHEMNVLFSLRYADVQLKESLFLDDLLKDENEDSEKDDTHKVGRKKADIKNSNHAHKDSFECETCSKVSVLSHELWDLY